MSLIHQFTAPSTDGFVAYSDGVHDDVNKIVWLMRSWAPEIDPREICVRYSRFFFSPEVDEMAGDGIMALEQNWYGPLKLNGQVEGTLELWTDLETAHPELDWQLALWQLCLMRANYDAYVRRRLIAEESQEDAAEAVLRSARELGSDEAMRRAEAILARGEESPDPELRQKVVDLCEALWQSVQLQTSVEKYQASGLERGAVLDFIDRPVNDRWWLEDELARVRRMPTETEKIAWLVTLGEWEHPPAGSYYDDIGNVAASPRVLRGEALLTDPLFERSPNPFFMWWDDGFSRAKLAWQCNIHWPLGIVYRDIDRSATYTVRVTGHRRLALRVNGHLVEPTVDSEEIGEFRVYPVPENLTATGTLTITFDDVDAGNVHWREYSRVNEVWLLKN